MSPHIPYICTGYRNGLKLHKFYSFSSSHENWYWQFVMNSQYMLCIPVYFLFNRSAYNSVSGENHRPIASQWLLTGCWFSPGTPVFSTNKTDCQDITEILLIVVLITITPLLSSLNENGEIYLKKMKYIIRNPHPIIEYRSVISC